VCFAVLIERQHSPSHCVAGRTAQGCQPVDRAWSKGQHPITGES